MHKPGDPNGVNPDDLKCLVWWPNNSIGANQEEAAVRELVKLMNVIGYGRIPQLADQIRDIWYSPEKIAEYQKRKEEHLELLDANFARDMKKVNDPTA
jgi:hypothetical protein